MIITMATPTGAPHSYPLVGKKSISLNAESLSAFVCGRTCSGHDITVELNADELMILGRMYFGLTKV